MKLLQLWLCLFIVCSSATAEVITDGSLGAKQSLVGNMTISQELGKTVGNNLFHSFQTFNVNTGESATFTGDNTLKNVISRVTGGEISNINGLLQSKIGNANFYFINPAGIVFGANATIDVPAAFHVSTADKLVFADGKEFSTVDTSASSLSIAEPASFGFLGNLNNGNIEINGSQLTNKTERFLDLIANNINIQNTAQVLAPAGEIRLVALKGEGVVTVQPDSLGKMPLPTEQPSAMNAGNITINNSLVSSKGDGAGRTTLWANVADINGADGIRANNTGNINATNIKGIEIHTNTLSVTDGARIGSIAEADGSVGSIEIITQNFNIANHGNISANAYGNSNSGEINIKADILKIDGKNNPDFTGISAQMNGNGIGGVINIDTYSLDIQNGSEISTSTYGSGKAGSINILADNVYIDGQKSSKTTGINSTAEFGKTGSTGNAGLLTVNSHSLNIMNGGQISSSTFASGNAGSVNIKTDTLYIDSQKNSKFTGIASETSNRYGTTSNHYGDAGTVNVNSGKLTLANGGAILSSTTTDGKAGFITVSANTLDIYGQSVSTEGKIDYSKISSAATATSKGQTGDIQIIATKAIYLHDGGIITIQNDANLDDPHLIIPTEINLSTVDMALNNGQLTTAATDNIDAGNIKINFSNELKLSNNALITSEGNKGAGGALILEGGNRMSLNRADIHTLTNSTITTEKGGDVNIRVDVLILNNAEIIAQGNLANGGYANLKLKALIASQNQLTVNDKTPPGFENSQQSFNIMKTADSGWTTPQLNLSGSISILNHNILVLPDIDKDTCNAVRNSSFGRKSKGGIPITDKRSVFFPNATIPELQTTVKSHIQLTPFPLSLMNINCF